MKCCLLVLDEKNNLFKKITFYSKIKYTKEDFIFFYVINENKVETRLFAVTQILTFPQHSKVDYSFNDKLIKVPACDILYVIEDTIDFDEFQNKENNLKDYINF